MESLPKVDLRPCIYVVTPTPQVLDNVVRSRDLLGSIILPFDSSQHFLRLYDENSPSCIVMCVKTGASECMDLIHQVLSKDPIAQIVLCIDSWPIAEIVQVVKTKTVEVLSAEWELPRLHEAINHLIEVNRSLRLNSCFAIPSQWKGMLTTEESAVLELILQGKTTKQVGALMDLSVRSVYYRKKSVFEKLGVPGGREAVELVRKMHSSR